MSRSVNKVILLGNLGKDPELKATNTGTPVARFSMATSERWKDKNSGEMQEKTEWHNIVCWSRLAETASKYLTKGSSVYIEGRLQTRSWDDKEGKKHYSTEVVANEMVMVGGARGAARAAGGGGGSMADDDAGEPRYPSARPEITDDDVPF